MEQVSGRKPFILTRQEIEKREFNMNDLNRSICEIQEFASSLSVEMHDPTQILGTLLTLSHKCDKARNLIESSTLSAARSLISYWKSRGLIEDDIVTFRQLAIVMSNGNRLISWRQCLGELKQLNLAGIAPAVKKHGRPYATKETLAAWFESTSNINK